MIIANEARIAVAIAWVSTAIIATTAALSAFAAPAETAKSAAQARYESEKAACLAGKSGQDRETCLREAGAALGQARSGDLSTGATPADRDANRLARCELQPPQDRAECVARIEAGKRSGSVEGGGVGYELTTRKVGAPTILIPVTPPQQAPARAASAP